MVPWAKFLHPGLLMILTGVFIGPTYEAYKHAKEHITNTTCSNTVVLPRVYLKNKYVCIQNYFSVKYISV